MNPQKPILFNQVFALINSESEVGSQRSEIRDQKSERLRLTDL